MAAGAPGLKQTKQQQQKDQIKQIQIKRNKMRKTYTFLLKLPFMFEVVGFLVDTMFLFVCRKKKENGFLRNCFNIWSQVSWMMVWRYVP